MARGLCFALSPLLGPGSPGQRSNLPESIAGAKPILWPQEGLHED